jgi:L-lysine 6-transaminase
LGALCAVDLPSTEVRNRVLKRCHEEQLIILACGTRSLRFRPFLNIDSDSVAECLLRFERAVRSVLGAPHTSAA